MALQIFGAGMAGLLAAEVLRREHPVICEAQPDLPNNHGALLRFRSNVVARETRQAFAPVRVHKAVMRDDVLYTTATLGDNNRYAQKVSGRITGRSVLNLDPCDRWVAPADFLPSLAARAYIQYNTPMTAQGLNVLKGQRELATISTIPMPALMKLVDWPTPPAFDWRPIWSLAVWLDPLQVNVFQTIYYPGPSYPYYRASITGSQLIIEYAQDKTPDADDDLECVMDDFGIPADARVLAKMTKRQEYGKLLPLPNKDRHEFMVAMTDTYNLYSVGRFATWRQILLDDVVHDIHVVSEMITQRSSYYHRLHTRTIPT